jgi:hypothetical protein
VTASHRLRGHGYRRPGSGSQPADGDFHGMSAHNPPRFEIDERFLQEWVDMGIADMAAYLSKYARFAAFCEQRDRRSPQS